MRKLLLPIILAAIAVIVTSYYFTFYPPTLYKRAAQQMLDSLTSAVETQTPERFNAALDAVLADSATIVLKVGFPSAPGERTKNVIVENFTKLDFLRFLGNLLYSLKDYHHKATVLGLELSRDHKTGELTFGSNAQATGMLGMDGNRTFKGDSLCSAKVAYTSDKTPLITSLSCVTQLY